MKTPRQAHKKTISRSFFVNLLVIFLIGFVVSVVFTWTIQTYLSYKNAEQLLFTNVEDMKQKIGEASGEEAASAMGDMAHNWHVGISGYMLIADAQWKLIGDPKANEGKDLSVTGLTADVGALPEKKIFHREVYGEKCSCVYETIEGCRVIAVMPETGIFMQRDNFVLMLSVMIINVFIALAIMVFVMIRRTLVKGIDGVNASLAHIMAGDLDEVVDERRFAELSTLSDDINATVTTLKKFIRAAAERIDAELAFARRIQESALPTVFPPFPDRKEFSLFASMNAAREVGGDFYDYYLLGDGRLGFLVADVSGKSIPAALFMMAGKTAIRDFTDQGESPADIFQNASNRLWEENETNMFITAWMGFLDPDTGLVRFVNAGHNPPVLVRGGKASFIPQRVNMALAGMKDLRYREQTLQLERGDLLFLYTDGVTEAADEQEQMFGTKRLLEVLSADFGTGEAACENACAAVKAGVSGFAGTASQSDDITMLCLYYGGMPTVHELYLENAELGRVSETVADVDAFLARANCSINARFKIALAVEEILTNIAQYAYAPGTGPVTIRIEMEKEPRAAIVTFIDRGVPYDPLTASEPDVSHSREQRMARGVGIHLVKKSMDEVSYDHIDGQNVLTLRKRIDDNGAKQV